MLRTSSADVAEAMLLESGGEAAEAEADRSVGSARFLTIARVAAAAVIGMAFLSVFVRYAPFSSVAQTTEPVFSELDDLSNTKANPKSGSSPYDELDTWLFDGSWNTDPMHDGRANVSNAPRENRHDGNLCGDDEEIHNGLCYKKCILLTGGAASFRCSPFSCSNEHPCHLMHELVRLGLPCTGYDVGGNINGQTGECPHPPGTCLQGEELLLGICYKKCSTLTGGSFSKRIAPTTCCKASSDISCLDPFNLRNSLDFGVGIGKDTLPHVPLVSLTES